MSALRLSRRGLFGGFAALLAAPAIVRVASIMPVAPVAPVWRTFVRHDTETGVYTRYSGYDTLNIDPESIFSRAEYDWNQAAVTITAERSFFVSYA